MSVSLIQSVVSLPQSPFPPIAVGLLRPRHRLPDLRPAGTVRLPQARRHKVDFATGMWGIWMPGFMQFITGVYLFLGLTLFRHVHPAAPLYMAALAFTAYGVHWFGWAGTACTGAMPG